MKNHRYAIVAKNVELSRKIPDLAGDALSREIAIAGGKLVTELGASVQQLPNGPWEAVSHHILITGDTAIMTFLLRA